MEEILCTVLLSIAFIVPGFIITSIKNSIIANKDKEYSVKLIDFFVYSFFNLFLWAIPLYAMYTNLEFFKEHYIICWILLLLIIFVSPVVISLVIIIINKKEVIRNIFSGFGINTIEPEPSAWDFKFSNMKSEWVIVTLKDDKIISGFMGSDSCASSNENNRDLYINEVYLINNGKWEKVKNTDGILIKQEEIKYIEFFNDKKEEVKYSEKNK